MKEKGYFIGDQQIHLYFLGRRMCDGKEIDGSTLYCDASIFISCDECREVGRGKVANWMIEDLLKASEVIKSHLRNAKNEGTNDTN